MAGESSQQAQQEAGKVVLSMCLFHSSPKCCVKVEHSSRKRLLPQVCHVREFQLQLGPYKESYAL